jgi:catechol 2,3-dioxygenase-like lactoylglutathione lyase family enzyme
VSGSPGLRTGIAQIALSVLDGRRSHDWYAEGLGLLPAGTLRPTADLSAVQGVPDARVRDLLWLVDGNAFYQLEIFEYASPETRPEPVDRRGCDFGYARFGVWVADFDATVQRLRGLGSPPLTEPVGASGARRVCVLDPDGVVVELMEDAAPTPDQVVSPRPDAAAVTRVITVSVPDLDATQHYYADAIGLTRVPDAQLHTDEHEQLWLLPGAQARRMLLAGGDLWLELVQYLDPVGRPRSADYRISDQGILNIAVAGRSVAAWEVLRDRVVAHGYQLHPVIAREQIRVQYAYGPVDDAPSVEISYFDEALDARQGFLPLPAAG